MLPEFLWSQSHAIVFAETVFIFIGGFETFIASLFLMFVSIAKFNTKSLSFSPCGFVMDIIVGYDMSYANV